VPASPDLFLVTRSAFRVKEQRNEIVPSPSASGARH
jgi:hypothetical protein